MRCMSCTKRKLVRLKTIAIFENPESLMEKEDKEEVHETRSKVKYLGNKIESFENYKPTVGTNGSVGVVGVLKTVKEDRDGDVIYFKYKDRVVKVEDNPELHFFVKDVKCGDMLDCVVKGDKVLSIEGIKI